MKSCLVLLLKRRSHQTATPARYPSLNSSHRSENSGRHYAEKIFSLILACNAGLLAQSDRGGISGRVLDASGGRYHELGGECLERISRVNSSGISGNDYNSLGVR